MAFVVKIQTQGTLSAVDKDQRIIKRIFNALLSRLYRTVVGRYSLNGIARWVGRRKIVVNVRDRHLVFLAGLGHSERRAGNLELKEPETLSWIDKFESNSVFWDVGASTGIYSVYAAVSHEIKVISIEPSPYNTPVIAENVRLNEIETLVTILPIALSSESSLVEFELASNEIGASQHQIVTQNSHSDLSRFCYGTVAFSVDDLITHMNIPRPDYMKVDVDGLEHMILQGAVKCLSEIRSVLIEIPQNPDRQQQIDELLTIAGLRKVLVSQYNAIWTR
jgi:FkbM family methyltransferase